MKYDFDKRARQLKATLGEVHKSNTVLEAIYTYDELKGYYVRNIADLPYGLYVEPRRDRIVMNRQEFENTLGKACEVACNEIQKESIEWVDNEVMDEIEYQLGYLLSTIGMETHQTSRPSTKSQASKLGAKLGSALAKNIMYIFDDIIGLHRNKRKKK